MKTITVTDEQYDLLCKCQNLLNNQDNRCTANPIFGFIYKEELPTHPDYVDKYVWVDFGGDGEHHDFEDDEILIDYMMTYYEDELNDLWSKAAFDSLVRKGHKSIKDYLIWVIKDSKITTNGNLSSYLGSKWCEIRRLPMRLVEQVYRECFSFFESDIYSHYNMNAHNMPDNIQHQHGYAFSNYRTPLMNKLRELLMSINLEENNK